MFLKNGEKWLEKRLQEGPLPEPSTVGVAMEMEDRVLDRSEEVLRNSKKVRSTTEFL